MKRIVRLTERDLTRLVKKIIMETEMDSDMSMTNTGWNKVYDALSVFKNPKIIKWKDSDGANASLNWGSHKTGGNSWGLSVNSDGNISFHSEDDEELGIFDDITEENGFMVDDDYTDTLRMLKVDYTKDSYNTIQLIKSALNALS
jgi:hypothetical protein